MLNIHAIKRLLKTHYPGFIFGLPLVHGTNHIFIYHDVDSQGFTADLNFLYSNGYKILSTSEFVNSVNGNKYEKAVLLTFDDARRNFYDIAFPILRKFNAHATLFVPTFWMGGYKSNSGNSFCRPDRQAFMTWQELRDCSHSGLVDVQSHGHRHALVFSSPHLVTFASPSLIAEQDIYDWPMRQKGNVEVFGHPPLGTPIYQATPLLSASNRFVEDTDTAHACQEFVAKAGGTSFFTRVNWNKELHAFFKKYTKNISSPFWVSKNDLDNFIKTEFIYSQELFEAELGYKPRYFAYPWMLGKDQTIKWASEAGVEAVFGVGIDYGRIKSLKSVLPAFYRLKGDWLRSLPGTGRQPFRKVIVEKVKNFLKNQHIAH